MNRNDANLCIVISETSGLKRLLEKVYFHIENEKECGEALAWVAKNYGYLISPNIRIDCYNVIFGGKVARY